MLLIKPYLGCNISCSYCYEKLYRDHHPVEMHYDLDLALKKIEELHGNPEYGRSVPCLHGGEILCLPRKDIEMLLKKVFELSGKSSIQTNATKIDDDFIDMFKKYKTTVGVSWDGPGELSSFRPGTEKVGDTIKKMVKEGVVVSNIIVVSKANAGTPEKREKLKKWLLELKDMGVYGRINPCANSREHEIDLEELKDFYIELADFMIEHEMKWSPFTDIINGLLQKGRVCVFSPCDIFNTASATVVLGDGTVSSCMRTSGEHILHKDNERLDTRNEILSQVPQEYGGCKDCKYFHACYGGCPTSAIDDDWRNRTYLCPIWKTLFEYYEKIFNHLSIPLFDKAAANCRSEREGYQDGSHGDAAHGDHSDHLDGAKEILSRMDGNHLDSHGDVPYTDHTDNHLRPIDNKHQDDAFVYQDTGHNDGAHGDHFDKNNF